MGDLQQELLAEYSPETIRSILRRRVFESSAERTQAMREKLVDWLRAHMPSGYVSEDESMSDQESWLFQRCYDESMKITDAALNFLLVGMHVLRGDRVACLQGGEGVVEEDATGDPRLPPPQRPGVCRRRS